MAGTGRLPAIGDAGIWARRHSLSSAPKPLPEAGSMAAASMDIRTARAGPVPPPMPLLRCRFSLIHRPHESFISPARVNLSKAWSGRRGPGSGGAEKGVAREGCGPGGGAAREGCGAHRGARGRGRDGEVVAGVRRARSETAAPAPPFMILKDFPEGLWKILQDHGSGAGGAWRAKSENLADGDLYVVMWPTAT